MIQNTPENKNDGMIFAPENVERLREIQRIIGSTVIFSLDNKVLMGRKDPVKGGVYSDAWHIPGGGANEGENPIQTAVRETNEEVIGLNLTEIDLTPLSNAGRGEAPKTLENGERVWCKMEFNLFEVHLNKSAQEYGYLKPGDDFVELRWFSPEEQARIKQAGSRTQIFTKTL